MSNLVLIKKQNREDILVTTSKAIAQATNNKHHSITKLIQKHENELEKFGILRFEIEEIKGRGQPEKLYFLNEQQATLLITFMRNTEPVIAFKVELVKQFYSMRQLLMQKRSEEWKEALCKDGKKYFELNSHVRCKHKMKLVDFRKEYPAYISDCIDKNYCGRYQLITEVLDNE